MPLDKSKTKAALSRNVSELVRSGRPQNQALAISYRIRRGKAEGGAVDELVPPPVNPMAPPQALSDIIGHSVKKTADWAKVPGQIYRGTEPEVPGQWSETDDWRKDQLRSSPYEWGPQTAFSEVFWPRAGTNVGGSGFSVGSGAMPPKSRDWLHSIFGLDSRSATTKKTDEALKAIDDALRSGTSGVPRVRESGKPASSMPVDDVLRLISEALKPEKYADGGSVPWFARQGASALAHSGMINSKVAGRTDRIPLGVKGNSFVVPADTVSSLGQGNSAAGAHALDRMFKSAPFGAAMPSIPKNSRAIRQRFADGGEVDGPVTDIVAAGGEYVLNPTQVAAVGGGDVSRGHDILDAFVKHVRKRTIRQLKKMKGPKAS